MVDGMSSSLLRLLGRYMRNITLPLDGASVKGAVKNSYYSWFYTSR